MNHYGAQLVLFGGCPQCGRPQVHRTVLGPGCTPRHWDCCFKDLS